MSDEKLPNYHGAGLGCGYEKPPKDLSKVVATMQLETAELRKENEELRAYIEEITNDEFHIFKEMVKRGNERDELREALKAISVHRQHKGQVSLRPQDIAQQALAKRREA